jgi:hypothetical protein
MAGLKIHTHEELETKVSRLIDAVPSAGRLEI